MERHASRNPDSKVAQVLEERPLVADGLGEVWGIWETLHSMRPVGFGPAPVPPADIMAILDHYGVEGEARRDYFDLITLLESEWLSWAREEAAKKKPRPKPTGASRGSTPRR